MSYKDLRENQEPGKGQGVGKPKQGQGGFDNCVCPNCDYTTSHERGTPCNTIQCPECGATLIGG